MNNTLPAKYCDEVKKEIIRVLIFVFIQTPLDFIPKTVCHKMFCMLIEPFRIIIALWENYSYMFV